MLFHDQGETLSEEKGHANQAALMERAELILDFQSLIDAEVPMPKGESLDHAAYRAHEDEAAAKKEEDDDAKEFLGTDVAGDDTADVQWPENTALDRKVKLAKLMMKTKQKRQMRRLKRLQTLTTWRHFSHQLFLTTAGVALGWWFWAAVVWEWDIQTLGSVNATIGDGSTFDDGVHTCLPRFNVMTEIWMALAGLALAIIFACFLDAPLSCVCAALTSLSVAELSSNVAVYHCAIIMTLMSCAIGVANGLILCEIRWAETKRVIRLLCAPGGWTVVSFVCAVVVVCGWVGASRPFRKEGLDTGCSSLWWKIGAVMTTMIWSLVEVYEERARSMFAVVVPSLSSRRWWLVGRIPHDPEEASPYLHVLRELENEQITSVIASDEFVEQEKMVSGHLERAIHSMHVKMGKQFGLQREEMGAQNKMVDAQLKEMGVQIETSHKKLEHKIAGVYKNKNENKGTVQEKTATSNAIERQQNEGLSRQESTVSKARRSEAESRRDSEGSNVGFGDVPGMGPSLDDFEPCPVKPEPEPEPEPGSGV